jgi:hypothetical protein
MLLIRRWNITREVDMRGFWERYNHLIRRGHWINRLIVDIFGVRRLRRRMLAMQRGLWLVDLSNLGPLLVILVSAPWGGREVPAPVAVEVASPTPTPTMSAVTNEGGYLVRQLYWPAVKQLDCISAPRLTNTYLAMFWRVSSSRNLFISRLTKVVGERNT